VTGISAQPIDEVDPRVVGRRCWGCFKPRVLCVCARVPRIENRTEITILQHPRERFHPIGTARIAELGLLRGTILRPHSPVERSLAASFLPPPGTGLLFPHRRARELAALEPDERPRGLIVLDGTWGQASKLYRENGWLAALPHYALSPSEPSRYRIRREPRPNFISTIEAVVAALRILEPATEGLDALLTAFDEMIDAQVVYAHRAPRRPERKIRRRARGVLDPGDT
jgi:DTW domain-containing protein YfiP